MKRDPTLVALMVLAASGVGCSKWTTMFATTNGANWTTTFAITNGADEPVRVSYSWAMDPGSNQCQVVNHPPPAVADEGDEQGASWTDLAPGDYVLNERECSVQLTLAPHSAVRFDQASNYDRHGSPNEADDWWLAKYRVSVVGPDGEWSVSGMELVRQMERQSRTLFRLVYGRKDARRG